MADAPPSREHGWSPVSRSLDKLRAERRRIAAARPLKVQDLTLPDSELPQHAGLLLRHRFPNPKQNRQGGARLIGRQGTAIATQHFPSWQYDPETYLLACLLHAIGTTRENQGGSRLSFEFHGAFLSLDLLQSLGAETQQAELVAETIIRHQDLGGTGNVAVVTALIHFATLLDNAGLHPGLVHAETIESVVGEFPRRKWTRWFAATVRRECELKPWANTTRIEGFAETVEANTLMAPYD